MYIKLNVYSLFSINVSIIVCSAVIAAGSAAVYADAKSVFFAVSGSEKHFDRKMPLTLLLYASGKAMLILS